LGGPRTVEKNEGITALIECPTTIQRVEDEAVEWSSVNGLSSVTSQETSRYNGRNVDCDFVLDQPVVADQCAATGGRRFRRP
jgi:hypothetical protein